MYSIEEAINELAKALKMAYEAGHYLTTMKFLHEEFKAPSPMWQGKIFKRFNNALQYALGAKWKVTYMPQFDFNIEIQKDTDPMFFR